MTNQMQGEVLFKGWSGSTAVDWVYAPWMPVRGEIATFGVQVVLLTTANITLTWNVETRTLASSSVTALFASNQTITTKTTGVATNNGGSDNTALELVRYKFSTGSGASVTDFVVFRALPPSWRSNR